MISWKTNVEITWLQILLSGTPNKYSLMQIDDTGLFLLPNKTITWKTLRLVRNAVVPVRLI